MREETLSLWAFCPHCETLFLDVTGKEVVHSCPGKMVPVTDDSDDEYVRCTAASVWRPCISAVGMAVKLEPKIARRVVKP